MLPKGVGIARPPANSLPLGTVWQAVQSPARARYSPWLMTWVVAVTGCAPACCGIGPAFRKYLAARTAAITRATVNARPRSLRMAQRWLPHANGMRTRLDDSGEGSLGGSCDASQAATAVMSASDMRVTIRFMQSGSAALRSPTRQLVS